MLKRIISLMLICGVVLTATACDNTDTSSVNSQEGNVSSTTSENSDTSGDTSKPQNNINTENTPNKVDDTLPQCEPANFFQELVMKGKEGYYKIVEIEGAPFNSGLGYYDIATGMLIPLCAKPQCMHDGNDFCVATGGMDYFDKDILYNGYIYRLGADHNGNEYTLKLLRADLQGNELSTVSDIYSGILNEYGFHPVVSWECVLCHYGKLFFVADMYDGEQKVHQLFMVDLKSGESKRIYLPKPENNATRLYGHYLNYITADGDWLYYNSREVKFDKPSSYDERNMLYNRTVLYRFNIKSGETEIVSALPDIYSSFTVNDGLVYYTVADRAENTYSLYYYDTVNDKTVTIEEKVQRKYISGKYISEGSKVTVVTDRKYLYVCTRGVFGNSPVDEDEDDIDFYIYDLQGNKLMDKLCGLEELLDEEKNWSYRFYALDGEIYLFYHDDNYSPSESDKDMISGMYRIKTEDLINGSREWKKLYKYFD